MTISRRWMEDGGPVPLGRPESAPGPSPPVVWVPAEASAMGHQLGGRPAAPTPLPQERIERGFWIHQHLVTNSQYAAFLNDLRSEEVDIRGFSVFRSAEAELYMDSSGTCCVHDGRHDFPVVGVDWDGANAYARRFWMRLPTEAEWEYAARGPQSRVYPWGNDWEPLRCCNPENPGPPWDAERHTYADGRNPDEDDWATAHEGAYPKATRTVPRPLPAAAQGRERWQGGESWCGAVDMAGNLMEWCQDVWTNVDGVPQEDTRVVRGGNYSYGEDDSTTFCRRHHPPRSYCRNSVGFRCVTDWEAVEELEKRL